MTRQKFIGEPQQFTRPAACYIDNPSLEPILFTISIERYTDITVKQYVHTVN